MTTFDLSTRHANWDPHTGIFTSANYPRLHIPTHLTIDQFLFSYTAEEAAQAGDGEGHIRPRPSQQTWLIDSVTRREYRFEDCQRRSETLAHAFYHHLNLRPNQVVVIYAPNDIDYPLVIWATFRAGGIVSGANPSYTQDELAYQLTTLSKHFEIAGVVCHPQGLQSAGKAMDAVGLSPKKLLLMCSSLGRASPKGTSKEILTLDGMIDRHRNAKPLPPPERLKPGDAKRKLAFLSFSSGTTGVPKAVCIPHYSVIANVIQGVRHYDEDVSGERTLAVLPYYHIFGLVVVLHMGVYRNLANVVIPKFVFEGFVDCLLLYRPSSLCLVPPMVVLLAKHPAADAKKRELGRSMRLIFSGAAPMTEELVSAFRKKYPDVLLSQAYGMTETSTMVTSAPRMVQPAPGSSAGVLCPNVAMKIVADGQPVGFGELGEILIQSPSNALGYLGNPTATLETFGPGDFVRTGDEGYVDSQGWVYVVERLKELIKVKGNQVAPAELEGYLLGHPSVADVCVIGIPDAYAGELPRAFVVRSSEGLKQDPVKLTADIERFVSDNKIRYKWLAGGVEFVDSIPKNPSGKLLRKELREEFKRRSAAKAKL